MNLQELAAHYQINDVAKRLLVEHPPLAIAGPTGAGKGTITQYLTQTGHFSPSVSDTTRKPRPSGNGYEVDGVHYWFIDDTEALRKLQNGEYVEAKPVHGDTIYGTSIQAYQKVVDSGRQPILEIDVQGMESIMAAVPTFESILLLPPSFEVWEKRIKGRGDMNIDEMIKRFNTALVEYSKPLENPRFIPVINIEVIETAATIMSGAYRAEAYQKRALKLAVELKNATRAFLDAH